MVSIDTCCLRFSGRPEAVRVLPPPFLGMIIRFRVAVKRRLPKGPIPRETIDGL
jgi:hypothetical protein